MLLHGRPAFVVGGAVRDRLLGRPTTDIDIVLDRDPALLAKKIADAMNGSWFPLDEERGILRVSFESLHFDLAKIQGSSFEEDLARRDFTVNALAVPLETWAKPNWKKSVIDRHNGLRDIARQRVASVSPSIFVEDPLRLLRAFRIAAELDFEILPDTVKAISKHKKLIRKPAPERKREEMLRIFSTPDAYAALVQMEKSGLLDEIFPEAKQLRKTAPVYYGKGGVLKHTLESVKRFEEIVQDKAWFPKFRRKILSYLDEKIGGYPRLAHCKWALLLHDIGKPATMERVEGRLRFFEHEHVGADKVPGIAPRFRWSADETARYGRLVRNHMRPGNLASHPEITDKAIHRFFRDLDDDAVAMLLVSLGDHLTYLTPSQCKRRNSPHELLTLKMIRRYYTAREKVLPPKLVTGHDVMRAFNLQPSRLIGELLVDVSEAQSEGNIKTKEDALAYLKGRLAWHQEKIQEKNTPVS